MQKTLLLFLYILISLNFTSCADEDDAVEDAILSARIHLNTFSCDKALTSLNAVGNQPMNGRYLQTLASAYACKADFAEPRFFVDDLPNFGNPDILGGLTKFSTSPMTAADDDGFTNLELAINTLLYAGNVDRTKDPTPSRRAAALNDDVVALDINMQLMYLIFAQLGKYLYFFGNSSSSGIKGSGEQDNSCFLPFDPAATVTVDGNVGPVPLGVFLDARDDIGACDSSATGSPALGTATNYNEQNVCRGIVLLNNLLTILPSIIETSTSEYFDDVSGMTDAIDEIKEPLQESNDTVATVLTFLNQDLCEDFVEDNPEAALVFFFLFFETLFE